MYTHEQRLEMEVKDLIRLNQSEELAQSNDVYLYTTKHFYHGLTLYRFYLERKRQGMFKTDKNQHERQIQLLGLPPPQEARLDLNN